MWKTDNASLYGKGVFTTLRVRDSQPFLWDKHWKRLNADAAKIGLDLNEYTEQDVHRQLDKSIESDGIVDGRARITFSDDTASAIWSPDSEQKTSLSIITGNARQVPEYFKLTVSPCPVNSRSPLVGVKSCNYLENLMAMDEAKGRGFHEAIRSNEHDHVTSGCMSNLFWIRGDELFTPSLSTGCLAGTTREYVIENLECSEVEESVESLNDVESIFVTSAGIGVVQVAEFNGRRLAKTDHPINTLLDVARVRNVRL